MRRFRFFALFLFVLSLVVCTTVAQQPPPAKKKPPSLETEDVVTNPLESTAQTDPRHLTGVQIAGALDKVKSFRCYWVSNYGNNHFEVRAEVSSPDREHMVNVSGDGLRGNDEITRVGLDNFFRKKGSTRWEKSSYTEQGTIPLRRYISDLLKGQRLEMTGTEIVDDTPCLIYRKPDVPAKMKTDSTVNLTIWVRTSDRLPLKVLMDRDPGKVLYMFTFSDYNEEIMIEPPLL